MCNYALWIYQCFILAAFVICYFVISRFRFFVITILRYYVKSQAALIFHFYIFIFFIFYSFSTKRLPLSMTLTILTRVPVGRKSPSVKALIS